MKSILNKLTYGHYILTALKSGKELETRDRDYIAAGTVNWAGQVSFKPPMVAVSVGQKSDLNETINYSGRFTLHILGEQNRDMIEAFGSKSEIEDGTINGYAFSKKGGQVILDNTIGYVECVVKEYLHLGDHFVYFGEVVAQKSANDVGAVICTKEHPVEYREEIADA
ncbi:MAG TPA: flavin reductase family protein [Cryomorphaceae bacterium]|nr:flavin reductase family protein [Cryomorphaceae bacterium]HKL39990.1 flavin reductase family protein [Cryomorphaceae bacterium]